MATIPISETAWRLAERRAAEDGFASVDEYIKSLIERTPLQSQRERVEMESVAVALPHVLSSPDSIS